MRARSLEDYPKRYGKGPHIRYFVIAMVITMSILTLLLAGILLLSGFLSV